MLALVRGELVLEPVEQNRRDARVVKQVRNDGFQQIAQSLMVLGHFGERRTPSFGLGDDRLAQLVKGLNGDIGCLFIPEPEANSLLHLCACISGERQ